MGSSCSSGRLNKRDKESFMWKIDGFSSLLDKGEGWINYSMFDIKEHEWCLLLNTRGKTIGDGKEYVSLALALKQTSLRPDIVVQAVFKFFIYDQLYGEHIKRHVSHHFQTVSPISGTSCTIPLETLMESSSGFLFSDSCIFGVEFLKVDTLNSDATLERLFVQKSNIFSDRGMYTWDIESFTLQSPFSSPASEIGGYKWY